MGDEPAELETGLHGDGEERGFVGDRGGVAAAGVEGDDGEASVCRPSEVYWGGGWGEEGICPEDSGGGGVETFARAAAGRFLAWTMCDPSRAVVAVSGDAVMEGAGELSLGRSCWRGTVEMVDLGVRTAGSTLD